MHQREAPKEEAECPCSSEYGGAKTSGTPQGLPALQDEVSRSTASMTEVVTWSESSPSFR